MILRDRILEIFSSESINFFSGINEVTRAIENEAVSVVLIASDVDPLEIVSHLFPLASRKKCSLIYGLFTRKELSEISGRGSSSSSIAFYG